MKVISLPTYKVKIYIAGDYQIAKNALRKLANPPNDGLCVTLENCDFVYTFGAESGVIVGLLNYPRFPKKNEEIWNRAIVIANELLAELSQASVLVCDDFKTIWITRRCNEPLQD